MRQWAYLKVPKVYMVTVDAKIPIEKLEKMTNGIEIEPGKVAFADIYVVEETNKKTVMQMTLYQGLNRQIRKMVEAIGYEVKTLKRIQHASLTLDGLKKGEFKPIKPQQIKELRNFLNRIDRQQ